LGSCPGTEPIVRLVADHDLGSWIDLPFGLPRSIEDAVRLLRECRPLIEILGERFVLAYTAVKESEYDTFLRVISSWEREHLLLNV
jgi:glutamine synthetase